MLNKKKRPWCILLKISILAHTQNWQNPTYIFSLSFLFHPHRGLHKVCLIFRRNVTSHFYLLHYLQFVQLCIASCILQPSSRFVLVATYNYDRNGILQAVVMYSNNRWKEKKRGKCDIFLLRLKWISLKKSKDGVKKYCEPTLFWCRQTKRRKNKSVRASIPLIFLSCIEDYFAQDCA